MEISDFLVDEFYGFCNDYEQKKEIQAEPREEMGDKEYIIATYGEETAQYKEAKMDLVGTKNDLDKQIELSCGFGELRSLGNFEESEKWNAMGEIERQEEVEDRLPKIQEEDENDLRAAISEMGENGWGQSSSPMQQETDDENLGNVEL